MSLSNKGKGAFKPTLLSAAIAASVTASFGVYAQEQEALEEVTVTGIRTSVLDSVEAKRNADVVADVVDAGALASLPDQSIADALGRLPGVTTVRDSGQSSQLNIRGMNGDFLQTTLNGREQASTAGYTESTRWISFDQYPAELISQAAVYKSPKASHIEGGVAGSVELKTANPLDAANPHNFNANVRMSYNDGAQDVGADEFGQRVTLSYMGKFMDDKLGVSLGYSNLEQPNSFTKNRAGADGQIGYDNTADINGDGSSDARARAFQWQAGNGTDTRNGYLASVVFQPTDNLKAQLDYFKSDFERIDTRHGITVGGLQNTGSFALSDATVNGGVVTGATVGITDPKTEWDSSPWFEARTEDQSTQADTDSIGLNLEWNINDRNTLVFDYSTSEGTKTRKDQIASMHAYDLTTDANGNLVAWEEAAGQSFTYSANGDGIANAMFDGVDFTDLSNMRLSRYEEYPHKYTDEVEAFKVDYKFDLEWGAIASIEAGFRSSERTFDSDRGTFLYGSRDGQYNGYCADNLSDIECMPQELDGFVKVGSVDGAPDHFVITDMDALATSIFGAGNYNGKKVFSRDWTFVESGSVTEDVFAYYLMANIDTQLGGIPVTGNFGVRVVETDIKASGLQNVGSGNGISITDDVGMTQDNYDYVTYGPEFTDTLPSLNLNFELTEQDYIRFAAAKVLGRPPVGQLKGGAGSWNSVNSDGNDEYNVWTKGSPYLDPFRANQIDLAYEHYFEDGGAVTAALFWKDIESLVEKQYIYLDTQAERTALFDQLGIELPAGLEAGAFETYVNNDKGGYIRGIELAGTKTFDQLPGIFAGLGLTASYSYTESETEVTGGNLYGQSLPLPGLSENVWSTTAFWDIGNFSSHINVRYRDEFILNMPIPGSSTPVMAQDYTTVDAQVSYGFDNGIDVVFSANNLTDEGDVKAYGVDGTLGEYTEFGRQYYLGVNYKY
ncbi:phosphoribosylformimino-5-aminoimidazole carboxamide ribotide isomerase [Microbulbifer donghaiensis]|uniref:Phosphoribosylformimino-5-aminoimidazole carboxamide ribotide isomerase n=1 Tax=Microbulbifer donghaiensis TaxID=494016 RepID=A0A1M5FC13_9GAMM|nr:TonB-dependent receptor [Microbulbifer donghaiensis]SHF88989.1 phosphoribosylformimino-5-aminoimidazole carboxamide ribotide isomerase [Microbulbifer donghaiensis]